MQGVGVEDWLSIFIFFVWRLWTHYKGGESGVDSQCEVVKCGYLYDAVCV